MVLTLTVNQEKPLATQVKLEAVEEKQHCNTTTISKQTCSDIHAALASLHRGKEKMQSGH